VYHKSIRLRPCASYNLVWKNQLRTQFPTDSQSTILQLLRGNGQERILSWQRLARSIEYTCHEGNYAMGDILREARLQEKAPQNPAK